MSIIFRCIYGPELFRIYRSSAKGDSYAGNAVERTCSTLMTSIQAGLNIGLYACPIVILWLYKRDYFTPDGLIYLGKCIASLSLLYFSAYYIRGLGRVFNPEYRLFIDVLAKSARNFNEQNKALLAKYDFDFRAWPVEYSVFNAGDASFIKELAETSTWKSIKQLPLRISSWLMLHSFGIKLIYPGSIQLLQASISAPLQDGRGQMINEKQGQRYKVVASDGNHIDTMFFDRRKKNSKNGTTLVISCDGNAGFYEIGVLGTPLEAGFSVLGWNHPGFCGSSGSPYPQEEANAAFAVMSFAINLIGFKPEDIILHGWSIGGFTASCLAMNFPDVKAVIIDASFDQLLPLAVPRMPNFLEPLVSYAVKHYVNLNIAEQLKRYPGPIQLVRRSMDEMITTEQDNVLTNRGNYLLLSILKHRYPKLIGDVEHKVIWKYLSLDDIGQATMLEEFKVRDKEMIKLLPKHPEYPIDLGDDAKLPSETKMKLVLFLAKTYLTEVDATHCSPLPTSKFQVSWLDFYGNDDEK